MSSYHGDDRSLLLFDFLFFLLGLLLQNYSSIALLNFIKSWSMWAIAADNKQQLFQILFHDETLFDNNLLLYMTLNYVRSGIL